MQESSRGADHGSDLRLHVSLYAGNCSEHVCTLLIGYRSGGTPGFHTFSGRVTELRAVDEGALSASAPATSRLFVLPVAARRWVSTENSCIITDHNMVTWSIWQTSSRNKRKYLQSLRPIEHPLPPLSLCLAVLLLILHIL